MNDNEIRRRMDEITALLNKRNRYSPPNRMWMKKGMLTVAFLTVVTLMAVSSTMARYAATADTTAAATVAAFVTGNTLSFDTTLGDMVPVGANRVKNISFDVTNFEGTRGSEVGLEYDIQLTATNNLPLTYTLTGSKQAGDDDPLSVVITGPFDANGKATGGLLPVAEAGGHHTTHSYVLTVEWAQGQTSADFSGELDAVTVTITTRQRDPGMVS